MISQFRKLLTGPGKWVVGGLVVAAFLLVGDFRFDNFGSRSVIEVGDQAFTVQDVDQAFARQLRQAQAQADRPLTREEAIEAGLLDVTIQQITGRALLQEEAERLGLSATDEMIQVALRESGAFDDPNTGEFSPRLLQLALQQLGTTPAAFKEEVREDIVRSQLVDAITQTTDAPENLARLLSLRTREERAVAAAVIEAGDLPPAEDEALRSFYAANAERYRAPERRRFRLLTIDPAAVAEEVAVSEDEVRQLFESRKARLSEPERRSYAQAVFRDAGAAAAAAEAIEAGRSLEEVAAEAGVPVTRFEDRAQSEIVDEGVAEALFATEEPGPVGPVTGLVGQVVAVVEDIEPGTEAVFEDERGALETELREELSERAIFDAVEAVELARDEGASLEEAAEGAGLPAPRTVGPVDIELFTADGAIEDVPPAAQEAAFRLPPGDESEAIPLRGGGYAFVAVDDVIPAATLPYEDVAETVAEDYAAEAAAEALDAAVAQVRAAMAEGQSFEDAAKAAGAEVQRTTVSARSPDRSLPIPLLQRIFEAERGEMVAVTETGTARLAVVEDISFAADPRGDALLGAYREQIGASVAQELLDAYLSAIESDLGVTTNLAAIEQQYAPE